MAADVILEALVGRVEGFADGHGEIISGLPIDGDLRPRDADIDADPDASAERMLAGTVHPHATFLHSRKEMSQLFGSVRNVLGKERGEEMSLVNDLHSNGHHASDLRAGSAEEAGREWILSSKGVPIPSAFLLFHRRACAT